jgi:anionic cell wall polymer biosynthesis LytR-Cps2A-Psr (LCP) family protein
MAQQTAVEWIEHNIQSDMNFMEIMGLIRQAKAMEKEQIQKAFVDGEGGYNSDDGNIERMADDYYNKTYNK